MALLLTLAFLGGALTIASPCILPVLPFVLARAGGSFARRGLPLLAGMVLAFAGAASLGAAGAAWAVQAHTAARAVALGVVAAFGLVLLFPQASSRWTAGLGRPFAALGDHLSQRAGEGRGGAAGALLLGLATGLLWVPCAGPILGLVLTGAASEGASLRTAGLLGAYAAGAATLLGLVAWLGQRAWRVLRPIAVHANVLRRAGGVAVLASVVAMAAGLDARVLAQVVPEGTTRLEESVIARLLPAAGAAERGAPVESGPGFSGATGWHNTREPLSLAGLRGRVVLVNFWTYSCINCLRSLPYVRAWSEKYAGQGLAVVGVHTPEFAFEKDERNVRRALADLKIGYPVAQDNGYAIWRSFGNRYWPAFYVLDAEGRIRHRAFGEGGFAETERVLQQLLAEAGGQAVPTGAVHAPREGVGAPADLAQARSGETYLGFERADSFASPGALVPGRAQRYESGALRLNQWSLSGIWTAQAESVQAQAGAALRHRFHARDLHLVLGRARAAQPVRFVLTIDGAPPGASHGVDVAPDGTGVIHGERLYQLVRQVGPVRERTFEIRFLDAGAEAYAFTFG